MTDTIKDKRSSLGISNSTILESLRFNDLKDSLFLELFSSYFQVNILNQNGKII